MDGNGRPRRRALYRVVLADDNEAVLEQVQLLLRAEFEIAACVCDGRSLFARAEELRPDAVVADVQMPGRNGVDTGAALVQKGFCPAIVILTVYNDRELIRRALRAGIRGFVLKVDAGEELVSALHAVIAGERYLSRGALASWAREGSRFDGGDESPAGG